MVALLYASTCGGPYGTENYVATTGPGLLILLIFVTPWFWGVPVALATAELASSRPVEGGYYRWVRESLGDFWGYQAGACTLIASVLDNTLYPVLFARSLRQFLPGMTPMQEWLAAVVFIAILTYLNYLGIRIAGGAAVALNVFLISPLVCVTVLGLIHARFNPVVPFTPPGVTPWAALGGGLALSTWLYSGYAEVSTVAEEVDRPKRNLPLALLIVTPLVIVSYATPILAGLMSFGRWETWGSGQFIAIGEALGGPPLRAWVFLGSAASQSVIFMTYLLWYSRVAWAMARDRTLPSWLARLHPRRGTPYRVLILYAAVYSLLARFDFEELVVADMWASGAYHLLLLATLVRIRWTQRAPAEGFRVPGGRAGTIVNFLVPFLTWVLVIAATADQHLLLGGTALLLPPLLYLVPRRKNPIVT